MLEIVSDNTGEPLLLSRKFPLPMLPRAPDPAAAREFAFEVVARLRRAGYEAVWAGGCVRDELLGRTPSDYDIATSARPAAVREIFGHRRTLAVGAAFGVITVLGPKPAGQVEVATFRADAPYTDGRHPAGVTFCGAREDALRRDFTINGLFFDPLEDEVIDYVGGQLDLADGIVRAIGVPSMRFGEDHLRMLRAVRFSAGFGFPLERETRRAIESMAHLVESVSPERIAAELRAMCSRPGRSEAISLLVDTGLVEPVFHEFSDKPSAFWSSAATILDAIDEPDLPLALAILCRDDAAAMSRLGKRLRLANHERKLAAWLVSAVTAIVSATAVDGPASLPWSELQPWLADAHRFRLADLLRALAANGITATETAAWVSQQVERPATDLDPPPLLGGDALIALGVPAGPAVGQALRRLRNLQLDGRLASQAEAVEQVKAWLLGR
ncbi:MAG: CCA tRNA nucleotidyltransferase [Planctomycetia bacterium]|nr:CCA tRNA nucleotidyltransferase [Planctomycetia bacterium]